MKKRIHIAAALLLSSMMAVSAGAAAMTTVAANYDVTIKQPTGNNDTAQHTYEAYQVFKGDLSGSGDDVVLSNITWGTGVNGTNLLAALKASADFGATNPFAGCTTAADVADVIDKWEPDNADNENKAVHKAYIQKFADIVGANLSTVTVAGTPGNGTLSISAPGYYFIKDKDNTLDNAKLGAYTDYILRVVGPVEIEAKEEVPTIQKKILEDTKLKEANTASIGDVITFQLDSKVPDMSAYNKYYYVINDTMCDGLEFNEDSVKIYIDGSEIESAKFDVQTGDAAKVGDTQYTFQIVMDHFKDNYQDKAGKDIKVTYTATLTDEADRTEKGNENVVNLTYSNNPNHEYKGENEPSDTPGDGDVTGITPDSKTKTYTTSLLLHKVDGADKTKTLEGAKFELKGSGVNHVIIANATNFEADENGTYYKLKDGTYTLTAPTDATKDQYESTTQKYSMNATSTQHSGEGEDSYVEAITDVKGILTFAGLGAGSYTLTETEAPEGYNKLANPIDIEITAAPTLDAPNWKITKDGVELTKPTGIYECTVENNKGTTLPTTGGIGTTLFYVVGGTLVAGAVVLLITKKRMSVSDKK